MFAIVCMHLYAGIDTHTCLVLLTVYQSINSKRDNVWCSQLGLLLPLTVATFQHCRLLMTILGKSDDGWPDEPKLQSGPPVPIYSIILAVVWVLPVLLYWGLDFILTRRRRIVEEAMSLSASQQSIQRTESELSNVHTNRHLTDNLSVRDVEGDHFPVMLASLEHSLPHLAKARATAGGLGKVVDLISRKHPTDILLVHPMLEEVSGQVEYGKACDEDPPLRLVVEGVRHDVQVFRYKSQDTNQQPHVEFLMFLVLVISNFLVWGYHVKSPRVLNCLHPP